MSNRLNSIPLGLPVLALALALVGGVLAALPVTSSFTDSQGLTVLYRYSLRDDWDPTEARGVLMYFHGQATATGEDMLDLEEVVRPLAWERGLVPVVVASPRAVQYNAELFAPVPGFGTRYWYPEDARLVHELLQTGLGTVLSIDDDRIFFWGDSLGPCFLSYFLEKYGGVYGGGLYARCGCFWGDDREKAGVRWTPSVHWTPASASALRNRFRVFVQATTEDFLHSESVQMHDYYKNTLGLPTRGDLDAPGSHCAEGAVSPEEALDWLVASRESPVPAGVQNDADADRDGLENSVDLDDDGDGAADVIDAAPRDPREWLDSDNDGIGDFADSDVDGDGVDNSLDAFPRDHREWLDSDGDRIGNNLDSDDDGVPGGDANEPSSDARMSSMTFQELQDGYYGWGLAEPLLLARKHLTMPVGFLYPNARGAHQYYQYITLGDGPAADVQVLVDRIDLPSDPTKGTLVEYEYDPSTINLIYIDRNGNGNLTDDGPPSAAPPEGSGAATIEVRYSTGEVVPYGIRFYVDSKGTLKYRFNSSWLGMVKTPYGAPVLAGLVDRNSDGLFGLPDRRYASRIGKINADYSDIFCIDLDRDTNLFCWRNFSDSPGPEAVSPVDTFLLDGQLLRASIAPSGRTVGLAFTSFLREGGEGLEAVPEPRIADGGIVLADQYSGSTAGAPGAVAHALGTGFARPVAWARGSLNASGRIGSRIFDVCLSMNGIRTPLFHVSERRITFQVPTEVRLGPARVEVIVECGTEREQRSAPASFLIASRRPVFVLAARNPPVILNSKPGTPQPPAVGLEFPAEPATGPLPAPLSPGEIAVLYATGFGATEPALQTGELAPERRPVSAEQVRVWLGGAELAPDEIRFAGTSPGYAGLNELHVRIPDGRPPGRAEVVVAIDGYRSPRGPYVEVAPARLPASGQRFRDCAECPEMVVVPAGSFLMGSLGGELAGLESAQPVRRVTIDKPFAVGVYEVTFAEWDACLADGGCNGYRPHDQGWGRGRHPVLNVTWEDTQAYLAWLSGKTGQSYRLLSEAEWEYAARAWTQTSFSFGNSILPSQANYWSSDWKRTLPVGSFEPNAFGLFDMHGNASEWVQDCWHPSYEGAPTDGSAWESGPCTGRVDRGGSYDSGGSSIRAASRLGWSADIPDYSRGFRVAKTLLP